MKTISCHISALCLVVLAASVAICQSLLWETYVQQGMRAFQRGDYAEAERLFRAAVKESSSVEKIDKKALDQMATSLNMLANALQAQEKYADSEAINRKLLEVLELIREEGDNGIAVTLNNLGLNLAEQGKHKEAEEVLRRALSLREKHLGKQHPDTAVSLNNLGKVYLDSRRFEEAAALFERAFQILIEIPDKQRDLEQAQLSLDLCNNLGLIYTERKEFGVAERFFKLGLAAAEKWKGADHPDLVRYLNNYAALLRAMKRASDAAKIEARVRGIEAKK